MKLCKSQRDALTLMSQGDRYILKQEKNAYVVDRPTNKALLEVRFVNLSKMLNNNLIMPGEVGITRKTYEITVFGKEALTKV